MEDLSIKTGADTASDSWGFVGVVRVGEVEAFRTLTAYVSPEEARHAAQALVADVLGEMLAGRDWRQVRMTSGHTPLREYFTFSGLRRQPEGGQQLPAEPCPREA